MSVIKDGGPAFPHTWEETNLGGAKYPCIMPGMTLRDYFASQHRFDGEGASGSLAGAIMVTPCPKWQDDPLGSARWWAEAEARIRYIHADAMLAAREAPRG